MPATYRYEVAKQGRAGCQNKACKDAGIKIAKGELRFGSLVTIKEHQTWMWKHWGCVTPKQIENIIGQLGGLDGLDLDKDLDILDGYEELEPWAQQKIRKALEDGHVDDEDWKGDPELNRPGMKGLKKSPRKKKIDPDVDEDEVDGEDQEDEKPPKKGRKSKSAVEAEADEDIDADEPKPKKKKTAPRKRKAQDEDDEDKEASKPKAKKSRGKAAKKSDSEEDEAKGKAANINQRDGADDSVPSGRPSRGRKVARCEPEDDEDDEEAAVPPAGKRRVQKAKVKAKEDHDDIARKPRPSKAKASRAKKSIIADDENEGALDDTAKKSKKGTKSAASKNPGKVTEKDIKEEEDDGAEPETADDARAMPVDQEGEEDDATAPTKDMKSVAEMNVKKTKNKPAPRARGSSKKT